MTLYGMDRIKAAKISMLLDEPFYGSIASSLELKFDDEMPYHTAATDGRAIYFDSKFVDEISKQELIFVYGHELLHAVMEHPNRLKGKHPLIWNMATDYVVNSMLRHDRVGNMPSFALYDSKYENKSAEEIYFELMNKVKFLKIALPSDLGNLSKEEIKELADKFGISVKQMEKVLEDASKKAKDGKSPLKSEEVKVILKRAREQERQQGKTSAAGQVLVSDIEEAIMPWQSILAQYVIQSKERYSYRRINRKYIASKIILPTHYSEKLSIVVALDVSGSIDEKEIRYFLGEVFSIFDMHIDEKQVRVIQTDTNILYDKVIDSSDIPYEEIKKRYGFGGTDFTELFRVLKQSGNENLTVLFTDGYATVPSEEPEFPLIVVTTDKDLPYGVNIKYVRENTE